MPHNSKSLFLNIDLKTQRGQALFALLVLLVIGAGAAFFTLVKPANSAIDRDKITAAALAQAKEALIGWAVARVPLGGTGAGPNDRPGELPCPDTGNNANPGDADGTCVAGRLGRVPWRTLGIPEPKDGAGETLWYTLAGPFRKSTAPASNPINSDTKGNITVYASTTASTVTSEAVAVIFAPGAVMGSQQRGTATAACTTTGATIPRWRCAANYLETADGINNATTNGPFITGSSSSTYNDSLLVITTADLIPLVEKRVARDLLTLLAQYKTATAALGYNSGAGTYPWANVNNGPSNAGTNRGRIPAIDTLSPPRLPKDTPPPPPPPYALPVDWGVSNTPNLPLWFNDNGWRRLIYYAVAANQIDSATVCSTCTLSTLQVRQSCGSATGQVSAQVVLITPGPAGAGRPAAYPWAWSLYLEDGCNNDNSDDIFVWPTSTAKVRDQFFTIP